MYLVLELQQGETLAQLAFAYDTLPEAEQKYHQILSFAAVSDMPIHSAVLLDSSGYTLKRESYVHGGE